MMRRSLWSKPGITRRVGVTFRRVLLVCVLTALGACMPDSGALPTVMVLPSPTTVPQELIAWQAVSDSVAVDASRFYRFEGRAGDEIRLRLVLSDGDAYALLFDPDGNQIGRGVVLEQRLERDGVYTVQVDVAGNGNARYDLGLSYTNQENPALMSTPIPQIVGIPTPTPAYVDLGDLVEVLRDGEDVGGTLTESQPRHIYLYEGRAGDVINVNMARIDGAIDPLLRLFDEQGVALAVDSNAGGNQNARLFNIRLPQDGLYAIQATTANGAGTYRLILREGREPLLPDPPPIVTATPDGVYVTPTFAPPLMDTRLADHVPALGNVRRAGDVQRFLVEAQAGERISIAIQPYQNETLRPRFELYNPDGELVVLGNRENATSGDGIFLWGIAIEQTGVYSLFVSADGGTTGAYTVSYGRGESARDAYQGEISGGMPSDALMTERGVRHLWEMNLRAGDVIAVAVSPQDVSFAPRLRVTTLEGDVLAEAEAVGMNRPNQLASVTIERDGRYLIQVWDGATNPQGAYTLVWRYVNIAPTPTPVPRWATLVYLNDSVVEGDYQFYPFIGQAGQSLRIEVNAVAGSPLDAVVTLLDAMGREIAQEDDSHGTLDPDLRVILPEDGFYSVRVHGYLSGGAYRLRISQEVD